MVVHVQWILIMLNMLSEDSEVNVMKKRKPMKKRGKKFNKAEQFQKGLCFTCNKSGHLSMNCPLKSGKGRAQ